MLKTIIILILIPILAVVSSLFFIKANLHYQEIQSMKGAAIHTEAVHMVYLNELTAGYDELQEDYQKLYTSYLELDNLIVEQYQTYQQFVITGYSADDPAQGTNNIVATGFNLDNTRVQRLHIIAVDPSVIPLYSIVEIDGLGSFVALDTGGAIKGDRIDMLFPTKQEAMEFGKQTLLVRVIK